MTSPNYISNIILFVTCLIANIFLMVSIVAGETIQTGRAIEVLKNMEAGISSFRWTCDFETGGFSNKSDIEGTYKKAQGFARYSMLIDIKRKSYLLDSQTIREWTGGDTPFISAREKCSFDGTTYQELFFSVAGKTLPSQDKLGRGVISKDQSLCPAHTFFQDNYFRWQGLGIGIPLFFFDDSLEDSGKKPELISSFLIHTVQAGHKTKIEDTGEGIWKISIEYPRKVKTADGFVDSPVHRNIDIDINKGGIITNFDVSHEWEGKIILGGGYRVETTKNKNGQWVPYVVKQLLLANKSVDTFRFSDFEINPKVNKDDFVFDFPDGTYVEDFITKKFYKVGDIVDEDKAIDEFIRRHGLTGDIPAKIHRGYILRYFLIGAGIILIGIAVYQILQKRRKE